MVKGVGRDGVVHAPLAVQEFGCIGCGAVVCNVVPVCPGCPLFFSQWFVRFRFAVCAGLHFGIGSRLEKGLMGAAGAISGCSLGRSDVGRGGIRCCR